MPTVLHHYTIPEIEATEKHAATPSWALNAKLGRFTNFVNLLDMCAVSIPSGILRCPALDPQDKDSTFTRVDGQSLQPVGEQGCLVMSGLLSAAAAAAAAAAGFVLPVVRMRL